MRRNTSRTRVVLLAAGLWAALALRGDQARAQEPTAKKDFPKFSSFLSLATDASFQKKLAVLQEYLKAQDWKEAMPPLQELLDQEEDVFVPVHRKGSGDKATLHWASGWEEADRLFAALPPKALELYELHSGARAKDLLAQARKQGDLLLLAEVVRRYRYTRAGGEALDLLGTHHLDRGRYDLAAACFDRLLQRSNAGELPPLSLIKAALAYQRVGNKAALEKTWQRLVHKAPDGVSLGKKTMTLTQLRKELDRLGSGPSELSPSSDWVMFGGNPSRSALGKGSLPAPKALWQQATAFESITQVWVEGALQNLRTRSQPLVPGFTPLAVDGRVVYRSHRGVHALDQKSGKILWESPSSWSLESLVEEATQYAHANKWLYTYLHNYPHVLIDNSMVGTLSTDRSRVYSVEDVAVPPYPSNYGSLLGGAGQKLQLALAPGLTQAVHHSWLLARDLETGKAVWELGGPSGKEATSPLHDSHFLGAPLPLEGRLYVLTEKDQSLGLVCLEAATGKLRWAQMLAISKNSLALDGGRRTQAVHLAYGEGVLVCPSNAGAVVAVDPLTHRLRWAYAYREEPKPSSEPIIPVRGKARLLRLSLSQTPPNFAPHWKTTAPIIQDGKVIFTAPDEPAIHCLNLHDGSLRWKASRDEFDVYLAGVFDGKVLLVGKQSCRALRLSDGKLLWQVETGMPSGMGSAVGKIYYLPLQKGIKEAGPCICALDLEKGVVAATVAQKEVLGNLVFQGGEVISQTAVSVAVYPQRKDEKK
jgi:outer membrane protein assembly factor BamB